MFEAAELEYIANNSSLPKGQNVIKQRKGQNVIKQRKWQKRVSV
jgi:hypothetical protein